jgi:AcrR family transcriptional regulator
MATSTELKDRLQDSYIDFVLTQGHDPESVYAFCKSLGVNEGDFYQHYTSFAALQGAIWRQFLEETTAGATAQEVWNGYNAREKTLSFFFIFIEVLTKRRSFVVFSFNRLRQPETPNFLNGLRRDFGLFIEPILNQAVGTGEVVERRPFRSRYADSLWRQLLFVTRFWIDDLSNGFETTDEAIEKGVNLVFDFLGRSPLDTLIDYGRFRLRNSSCRHE